MEPEGSLPCAQDPVTGPYSEPDASRPHIYHLIFPKFILILSSRQRVILPSVLFPAGFPVKILLFSRIKTKKWN